MVINIIIGVLAVLGLGALCCAIMVAMAFARSCDTDEDIDRHRQEDEEQMEYLRKWRETHDRD